jgi:hypothetical protein
MSDTSPIPEQPTERWRREFIERIYELANGRADMHQVADWAIQAQQAHGGRDATAVANEEWEIGTPPVPD